MRSILNCHRPLSSIDEFWKIVEKGKDSDEPEITVLAALKELSVEELLSYQKHFDECFDKAYRWDIWGAAYIMQGGCSDDGFIDFRYGLISRGKDRYTKTLNEPDSLAEFYEGSYISNELFGYIAREIYRERTGDEMPYSKEDRIEIDMGHKWDFDDKIKNINKLPKLTKFYGL